MCVFKLKNSLRENKKDMKALVMAACMHLRSLIK